MSIQTGIHPFVKKLGQVVGYKRKYNKKAQTFEKGKGGPNKVQYDTLPSMAINRANGNEFKTRTDLSLFIYNAIKLGMRYRTPKARFSICEIIHQSQLGNSAPLGERGNVMSYRVELPLRMVVGDLPLGALCYHKFQSGWTNNGQRVFFGSVTDLLKEEMRLSPRATHFRFISAIINVSDTAWDLGSLSWVNSSGFANPVPVFVNHAWHDATATNYGVITLGNSLFPFICPISTISFAILGIQQAIYDGTNYNLLDISICASVVTSYIPT